MKDYNYYLNAVEKLDSIEDGGSLHVSYEVYELDGEKIELFWQIGSENPFPMISINGGSFLDMPSYPTIKEIYIKRAFLQANSFITKDIFEYLANNIKWHEELNVTGSDQKVKLSRKMAYVTDDITEYKYANFHFTGEKWNDVLLEIKAKLEAETGHKFNSVLLNYYKDGKDEIKWHSDKEDSLGELPVIACINLGVTRKFWFRKKGPKSDGNPKFNYSVLDGDLLIMGETCQRDYLHAIRKRN